MIILSNAKTSCIIISILSGEKVFSLLFWLFKELELSLFTLFLLVNEYGALKIVQSKTL